MVIDIDTATALKAAAMLIGSWFVVGKLMFMQFEKRLDARFETQNGALTELKGDLDAHMTRQDATMSEIRRIEAASTGEFRRLEAELSRCQLDALQRFQTKIEATSQHGEILAAIRALGSRIDQLHGIGAKA